MAAQSQERPPPEIPGQLPLSVAILRWIASVYLTLFKKFRIVNSALIPPTGSVILVANHTTAYDPVCLQVACPYRFVRFMQAREYYEKRPFHFLFKWLQVIPVNRNGNDTVSFRTALRTLTNKGCLGIFPEGKISDDGQLQEARKGVALLALMSNATIVPSYLHGTNVYRGMIADFFLFNQVTLYFGEPLRFDDLASRHPEPEALDLALERIMGAIVALHDRHVSPSATAIELKE